MGGRESWIFSGFRGAKGVFEKDILGKELKSIKLVEKKQIHLSHSDALKFAKRNNNNPFQLSHTHLVALQKCFPKSLCA